MIDFLDEVDCNEGTSIRCFSGSLSLTLESGAHVRLGKGGAWSSDKTQIVSVSGHDGTSYLVVRS